VSDLLKHLSPAAFSPFCTVKMAYNESVPAVVAHPGTRQPLEVAAMGIVPVRLCSVEGCGRRHQAKGLCKKHYLRLWKNGTLQPQFVIGDDEARFWSRVNKNGPIHPELKTPCWLWTGSLKRRYGRFWVQGGDIRAHRYSYILHKGPIPEDLFVCHSCDVPICVNPDHLWLGTALQNNQDMHAKGRNADPLAAVPKHAKLTEDQILEIRQLWKGDLTGEKIADLFKISKASVSRIVNGKAWRHVE
jgi:hypothetical protein